MPHRSKRIWVGWRRGVFWCPLIKACRTICHKKEKTLGHACGVSYCYIYIYISSCSRCRWRVVQWNDVVAWPMLCMTLWLMTWTRHPKLTGPSQDVDGEVMHWCMHARTLPIAKMTRSPRGILKIRSEMRTIEGMWGRSPCGWQGTPRTVSSLVECLCAAVWVISLRVLGFFFSLRFELNRKNS